MRRDLSKIVVALINNIGTPQVSGGTGYSVDDNLNLIKELAEKTTKGLSVLRSEWPNLEEVEKKELAAIIYALDIMYSDDEQSSIKVDNSQKKL